MSPVPRFAPWRPHPWHGLSVGADPPARVNAFIEITPFDRVKYEIDKESGYLRVDRPQRTSSLPPALYGFIPRTYAGRRVGALLAGAREGDHDPLDVCVLSERPIDHSEILVASRVIGGVPMLDGDQADDKIVAVLESDPVWGGIEDVSGLPRAIVDRLVHYFATYKQLPGEAPRTEVRSVYGRDHARLVVTAAMEDYAELVPDAPRA